MKIAEIRNLFKKRKLIRIGTDYGGWILAEGILNSESVCYSAGAGEDISFDVELVTKYDCEVFIFGPTPRALRHFETLKKKY